MKPITEFQLSNHGIEHAQYFQGAGISFTRWKACYTGCGDSAGEALDDAIDMMAQADEYDHASLPEGWDQDFRALTSEDETVQAVIIANCECASCPKDEATGKPTCTGDCECSEESELHHYVTIYVH